MPSQFKPFPSLGDDKAYPGYGKDLDSKSVEDVLIPLLTPLEDTFETKYSGSAWPRDSKSAFPYAGGETVALERIDWYFHQGNPPPVSRYKVSRSEAQHFCAETNPELLFAGDAERSSRPRVQHQALSLPLLGHDLPPHRHEVSVRARGEVRRVAEHLLGAWLLFVVL